MSLFDIYLERAQNAKTKSMKQVILELTAILIKSLPNDSADEVKTLAVTKLCNILRSPHEKSVARQGLHALTIFLSKGLIDVRRLTELFLENDGTRLSSLTDAFRLLLGHLFDCIAYQETALAAVRLVSSILEQKSDLPMGRNVDSDATEVLPVWVIPLSESVRRAPEAIHLFRHHVFPLLFKSDVAGYMRFLEFLAKPAHLPGEKGPKPAMNEAELELFLAALHAGKELGLVIETGMLGIPSARSPNLVNKLIIPMAPRASAILPYHYSEWHRAHTGHRIWPTPDTSNTKRAHCGSFRSSNIGLNNETPDYHCAHLPQTQSASLTLGHRCQ